MPLSPRMELRLAAFAGAVLELGVDFGINGAAASILKGGASVVAVMLVGAGLSGAGLFAALRFRPLTRRAAAILAFGATAVFGMLLPREL